MPSRPPEPTGSILMHCVSGGTLAPTSHLMSARLGCTGVPVHSRTRLPGDPRTFFRMKSAKKPLLTQCVNLKPPAGNLSQSLELTMNLLTFRNAQSVLPPAISRNHIVQFGSVSSRNHCKSDPAQMQSLTISCPTPKPPSTLDEGELTSSEPCRERGEDLYQWDERGRRKQRKREERE